MDFFPADEDYNLWLLLAQTRDRIMKVRRREMHQYGINPARGAVLFLAHNMGEKATLAEMARQLLRTSHSTSELVTRMEKEGLLRKIKDLDRKNLVRVALTKKGREIYNHQLNYESIQRIMSRLSEEDRRCLRSCLLKLERGAKQELKDRWTAPPDDY